jgi:DNA invertase Pin-like site-specific DNA recombinase
MSRLTLNVLLSFAEFVHKVIDERVRDRSRPPSARALWVGGPVPLGYRYTDQKLEIVPEEAEAVRTIFTLSLNAALKPSRFRRTTIPTKRARKPSEASAVGHPVYRPAVTSIPTTAAVMAPVANHPVKRKELVIVNWPLTLYWR